MVTVERDHGVRLRRELWEPLPVEVQHGITAILAGDSLQLQHGFARKTKRRTRVCSRAATKRRCATS